jgi:hypothetical protein
MSLKLVLICALACVAAANAAAFKGYLVTAQYQCDDFLCPDWELDVTRVDPAFRAPLTARLAMLVPKSPIASMSFPVLSAYNNASRIFYTLGCSQPTYASLWAVVLDANVNSTGILYNTQVTYPANDKVLSRVHALSNDILICVFKSGGVYSLNPKTGVVSGRVFCFIFYKCFAVFSL